ncbi:MAG: hypothetical protein MK364_17305, partial [Pirellulales bacterium]|nr:hypothetical protein [Pirellulales bacterium]
GLRNLGALSGFGLPRHLAAFSSGSTTRPVPATAAGNSRCPWKPDASVATAPDDSDPFASPSFCGERDPLWTKILEHYQEKPAFYRTEPGDHEACPLPQRKDTTHLYN